MRHIFPLFLSFALSFSVAPKSAHAADASAPTRHATSTAAAAAADQDLRYPVPTDFEFAYIDKTGKVVINGPFAMAHSFSQGVAVVNEKPYEWHDGHWTAPVDAGPGPGGTIIGTNGKTIGNSRLEAIEPFADQYTIAKVKDASFKSHFVLLDTQAATSPIANCMQATNFSEGLFASRKYPDAATAEAFKKVQTAAGNKQPAYGFGYTDKAGKLVIPYRYAVAGPFSEGLAAVGARQTAALLSLKAGQRPHLYSYSFIDKSGAPAVSGPFQETHCFKGGLAAVCVEDKWGFIDKAGKPVVPCLYDWVGDFSGPLAPVEKDNMVGFVDKSGKVVIPFKFKNAESFGDGLAPATTDGAHWGFIDSAGTFKIEPVFQHAHPFSDGLALVYIKPRTDIGTHPEEAEYFYKTSKQLREDGKLNDAVRYCDVAIKLAPESDWGKRAANLKIVALPDHVIKQDLLELLQVGTVSAEKRDFDQAEKIFKECLNQDPAFLQASGSLGYVLIGQQKYDEAFVVLTKALEKYPSYARGYLRLAQVYEGQGKIEEAQKTLDKAQNLAPDDLIIQIYSITATPR